MLKKSILLPRRVFKLTDGTIFESMSTFIYEPKFLSELFNSGTEYTLNDDFRIDATVMSVQEDTDLIKLALILNGRPKGIYDYKDQEKVIIPEPIEVGKINQDQMQKYHEYNEIIDIDSRSDKIHNAYETITALLQTADTDLQIQLDSESLDFKTMDQLSYEINITFGKQYII